MLCCCCISHCARPWSRTRSVSRSCPLEDIQKLKDQIERNSANITQVQNDVASVQNDVTAVQGDVAAVLGSNITKVLVDVVAVEFETFKIFSLVIISLCSLYYPWDINTLFFNNLHKCVKILCIF